MPPGGSRSTNRVNARAYSFSPPCASRWSSAPMFVITAASGESSRNELSLSSASAMKSGSSPWWALLRVALSTPPIAKEGSRPQPRTVVVSMAVVDVFPTVPATATARRPAMTEASAVARCRTGNPSRRASRISGLASSIALDTTTVRASPNCAASWPTRTEAPRARSAAVCCDSRASLPDTRAPRASMMRAMPLMPTPPIPTKCTRSHSVSVEPGSSPSSPSSMGSLLRTWQIFDSRVPDIPYAAPWSVNTRVG